MEIHKKIILVENDPKLGFTLSRFLSGHDFEVTLTSNGMDAFDKFRNSKFDICIIDIAIPHRDAYTLAKEIRSRGIDTPIIFLLGEVMEEDVLNGYRYESDDFLNKPFDPEFLLNKIKTIMDSKVLKTKKGINDAEFKIGDFEFNTENRMLSISGMEPIKLSPKENELLKMLAIHENNLMVRKLALTKIWRHDDYYTSRSMDVYITKLRKYLKADPSVEIRNVPNQGFKLVTENTLA